MHSADLIDYVHHRCGLPQNWVHDQFSARDYDTNISPYTSEVKMSLAYSMEKIVVIHVQVSR